MTQDGPNPPPQENTIQPEGRSSAWVPYDALLLVSFGGPERPEDVLPFLKSVLGGRAIPQERLEELAEPYYLLGGVSPLNAQNRALVAAVVDEFHRHGPPIAVYWGNRHTPPFLEEAVQQMADDGCQRALAFMTSAFGSYPGCRQYQEAIEQARLAVGPESPQIDKLRLFFNHPGFIESAADRVQSTLAQLSPGDQEKARLIFTAHSLPVWMAQTSPYPTQVQEACRLVAEQLERTSWALVYQSRSGPPDQPWLQPELPDFLWPLRAQEPELRHLVFVPIGFLSEHIEVIYDLDVEVAEACKALGFEYHRSGTVGVHAGFVKMIRELTMERIDPNAPRLALGVLGPSPDECPSACCPPPPPAGS